jgi:hypothetical protein
VDIQGAEGSVLRAAGDVLRRVSILLVEVTFLDPDPIGLIEFLEGIFDERHVINPVYTGADLAFVRKL